MPQTVIDKEMNRGTEWVPNWLQRQALTRPHASALVHVDGTLTYEELFALARRFAKRIAEAGVTHGDRVGVLARHGLIYAVAVHAVMQAGGILVPLNTRLTAGEISWQLNNVGAKLLICDPANEELAASADGQQRQGALLWTVELSDIRSTLTARDFGALMTLSEVKSFRLADVHAIVHTSGTTGNPKGVQITYQNHYWSATSSALQLGLDQNERWLVPMPLFHVGGLAVLMRSLIYGTTAVLYDNFDAQTVNDALSDDDITLVSVVPTMLYRMLADERRRPPSQRLRCILLGGSGASEWLLRRCQEEGLPVAQSYGLSEANSQVATLRPDDALRKIGSSGQPLFASDVRIVDDNGDVPAGVRGEIWVHSLTVTPGYWNRPDANAETFVDGWLRTGDIGYLDEEGYLYVLDRRKDLIVSGGENVYPVEVERAIELHEAVLEAGVIPVPDDEWGQVPGAYVVIQPGYDTSFEQLEAFCRTKIAGYKIPKRWWFVTSLPRNASGKLLRRQLVQWLNES
ncbi:o-succinylbenzoate--CoA ligase [Alicyclobacillus ferrooxydans]|nr:o-succinylbenzoate--CoA ligase [Alicyclobacillus ferrooxydans]